MLPFEMFNHPNSLAANAAKITRRERMLDDLRRDMDALGERLDARVGRDVIGEIRQAVQVRLDRAQARHYGMNGDSDDEARAELGFLANFRAQLDEAAMGKPVDLSRTVTEYDDTGELVPEAERLEIEHESHLGSIADLVGELRAAGVDVDTSFRLVDPPEWEREDDEMESVVVMNGREWWEDQRANILAGNMSPAEAQRELAALGPEPPEGDVMLDLFGDRIDPPILEADPVKVERTSTEEPRHEVGPLTLVNEREEPQQLGLEL